MANKRRQCERECKWELKWNCDRAKGVAQKCRYDSRASMLQEIGARPVFLKEVVDIGATLHRREVNRSV